MENPINNSPDRNIRLDISLVSDEVVDIPEYANIGDAAVDLRAVGKTEIAPFERAMIPCGFSIAIPEGYAGLVLPRSGLAANHGVTVLNAPGLIDSGYRGEIKVILYNTDRERMFVVEKGDRVAQLMLVEIPHIEFNIVEALDDTSRGIAGFGSSGIA